MKPVLLVTGCLSLLGACSTEPSKPAGAPSTAPNLHSGIERAHFDADVRPQDDLYRAVNGTWLAQTAIPSDKSNYGSFSALADQAEQQLRVIVEELSAKPGRVPGSLEQKIGDTYAGFMDKSRIESQGVKPIEEDLARVDALRQRRKLPVLMAELARSDVRVPLLPYVHQDAKDSTRYAGDLYQGGLSLPNRDFYLIEDDKFRGIRTDFQQHVERMWNLAGFGDGKAAARSVLALETKLAMLQWDKVELRDPVKRYNAYAVSELAGVAPSMDWRAYLDAVGYGALEQVLVSQPSYVTGLDKLLRNEPLSTWKTYFRWQVLNSRAPLLQKALVDENFAFFGRRLNGIEEIQPRWKRGVGVVEEAMGEAVGQIYVARHFPAQNKARMETLVQNLIRAYGLAIDELDWMSADTKKAAQEKLSKFACKIGYPIRWRDYTRLDVIAGDVVGNARRAAQFEYARQIAKLGQPIDREEWGMTPQTVNAYYNAEKNEIVFPAAILQPPFFDAKAEDAVNYGGIGAVIGHEISHGFDDKGSQYDGDGRLRMWWTAEDRVRFEALGARLAAQYDAYEPVKGYRVNGRFTLGENIADLGGLSIAHRA